MESTRTRFRPTLQPDLIRFLCLRLVVTLTHHQLTRAPVEHRQYSLLLFEKLVLGFFKRLRYVGRELIEVQSNKTHLKSLFTTPKVTRKNKIILH